MLRTRLIGLLWARSADAQARMSLRHALSELKHVANGRIADLIEVDRESVRLKTTACWIDVLTGDELSETLLEDLDGVAPSFDQWLMSERARLEDRIRSKLEAELDRLIKANALPQLRAAAARKLVSFEPTHEGAVRSLMSAFVQMGDSAQAIREYERCRQALGMKLDLSPSKETMALYEAVRLLSSRCARAPKPVSGVAVDADTSLLPASIGTSAVTSAIGTTAKLAGDFDPKHKAPEQISLPSIAVLPLRNISGDITHEYAGDGLIEDLIEILSRVPNLFVISRLSTLSFKNQHRLPQEIGAVLGVQYVLSGSMRIMGERLRLIVELTETKTGTALWSSRLDEKCFDLLEVQDRLSDSIVRRVAPYLHAAELKRVRLKRPDHLKAYDLFFRAQENMHNSSREVFESSEKLLDEALRLEPTYAAALAWRAYWHVLRVGQGWSSAPEEDSANANSFARRAVESDPLDPMGLAVQGHIESYLHKNFDLAFRRFETALRINLNAAPAWLWSAAANAWIGDGEKAIEQVNRAIALSPYDPLMYAYSMIAALAYLVNGQSERAIECALRSITENATYTSAHRILVIALSLGGRAAEAQLAARELIKLEPGLTVDGFRKRYPGSASAHVAVFCDALASAGVPRSA